MTDLTITTRSRSRTRRPPAARVVPDVAAPAQPAAAPRTQETWTRLRNDEIGIHGQPCVFLSETAPQKWLEQVTK